MSRSVLSALYAPIRPPDTPTSPIILRSHSGKPVRSRAFLRTPLRLNELQESFLTEVGGA